MASLCMSTARALVKPTLFRSSVRAPAVSAMASLPAFGGRNVAASRGLTGLAAAPLVSRFNQRASFHVSAAADGEDGYDGDSGGGGPVKLYVGNLSWGVDDQALGDIFGGYQASDMTVVSDMNTGRSRGFGFITVPDQAAADKCIADLDGSDLDGRPLRVNISIAKSGGDRFAPRDGPPRESSYEFDSRKIYFGNLSWSMDHLDLSDLCAEYGKVDDARLITDRETGRSRGFGFVTMSTADEAGNVVNSLNGTEVDGRQLRVNIANVDK